tara:strand:+ start:1312 stop:1476 length:165 start_codon:yes stop_codon:yes gene_type:complete
MVLGSELSIVWVMGQVGTVGDQSGPVAKTREPVPEATGNAKPVVVVGSPEFDYL